MILFVSDMHFGRGNLTTERTEEIALISLLQAFRNEVEHLFLLGDVFDQYIEYRHLVPKGLVRFKGLLADWTDSGIPVTYLKGNHDPWHIDYFERELGVRLMDGPLNEPLLGNNVYMHHGDLAGSRIPMYALIKRALRHPIPVDLYRTLLPGDFGLRLARWVNRLIRSEVIDMQIVEKLRKHAKTILTRNSCNFVVMGHSHYAERIEWSEGIYINTGCWRYDRTFACLTSGGIELKQWNGERASTWDPPTSSRKKHGFTTH